MIAHRPGILHGMSGSPADDDHAGVSRRGALRALAGSLFVPAGLTACASDPTVARPGAGKPRVDVEWSALQSRVPDSEVISRSSANYAATRQSMMWNARKAPRYPDAIVRAASAEDAAACVRFAADYRLKVAVRGGGHSWCASSVRDGGLLLDLGRLNQFTVDVAQRAASVQPVVRGGELVAALTPHQLAFPVGHCPSVPLSGYLLAGGFGWNSGAWGPACASVTAIEMIDARGESLRASESEHAELFWAARGAGPGFFGVVTRYHLRLHALPASIRAASVFVRVQDIERIARWLGDVVARAAPSLELSCLIMSAPPQGVPQEIARPGERVVMIGGAAFADDPSQADGWLAPLLEGPPGVVHFATPIETTSMQGLLASMGGLFPDDRRYAADVAWCRGSTLDALTMARDCAASAPSTESFVMLALLPPEATSRPPNPSPMAFSLVAPAFLATYAIWSEQRDDEQCVRRVAASAARVKPRAVGHYVGESDLTASHDRASLSFSDDDWQRLKRLKREYDPEGVFQWYL